MNYNELINQIRSKQSCLCVGLDLDLNKIPTHISSDKNSLFVYLTSIIDATRPYAVAYKLNTAFYEVLGADGWELMHSVFTYLGDDVLKIADAKRGDIGNTASKYAQAFYDQLHADAVTLHPYMGRDSIQPFLDYKDKWSIILACTSNPSADDFEKLDVGKHLLYEEIVQASQKWANSDQIMYVVGATQLEELAKLREQAKDYFFLIPGVGAQGGKVEDVMKHGMNANIGVLINASRSIMYASNEENFAEASAQAAEKLQKEMARFIKSNL